MSARKNFTELTERQKLEFSLQVYSRYASGAEKSPLKGYGIRWFRQAVKDVQNRIKKLEETTPRPPLTMTK